MSCNNCINAQYFKGMVMCHKKKKIIVTPEKETCTEAQGIDYLNELFNKVGK